MDVASSGTDDHRHHPSLFDLTFFDHLLVSCVDRALVCSSGGSRSREMGRHSMITSSSAGAMRQPVVTELQEKVDALEQRYLKAKMWINAGKRKIDCLEKRLEVLTASMITQNNVLQGFCRWLNS